MNINRRQALARTMSTLGLLGTSLVFATTKDVEAAISAVTSTSDGSPGALQLTLPEIAENGHSVPMSVRVDADKLAEEAFVQSVAVVAPGNPNLIVITYNFTKNSGEAFAATRMRLAKTQNVVAVAKISDGSVMTDTRFVKVTIGGCGA